MGINENFLSKTLGKLRAGAVASLAVHPLTGPLSAYLETRVAEMSAFTSLVSRYGNFAAGIVLLPFLIDLRYYSAAKIGINPFVHKKAMKIFDRAYVLAISLAIKTGMYVTGDEHDWLKIGAGLATTTVASVALSKPLVDVVNAAYDAFHVMDVDRLPQWYERMSSRTYKRVFASVAAGALLLTGGICMTSPYKHKKETPVLEKVVSEDYSGHSPCVQ